MSEQLLAPVFLISLPRSGSTLLQKMLSVSPNVHTVAEPWIMLPFAYMLEREGIAAEYGHGICYDAIDDLISRLPDGHDDFRKQVRSFVLGIYNKAANSSGNGIFLDKTPRYYLIVPFLHDVFPDAKFIFLFRHPLDVLASIFKSWQKNRFSPLLQENYIDLIKGPKLLASGYRLVKNHGLAVSYSSLVSDPKTSLIKICSHIEIDFLPEMLTEYKKIQFSGRMGDSFGIKTYTKVSPSSVEKWREFTTNHYRKIYVKRYLQFLGTDLLLSFGINKNTLMDEIDQIQVSWFSWLLSLRDFIGDIGFRFSLLVKRLGLIYRGKTLPCKR